MHSLLQTQSVRQQAPNAKLVDDEDEHEDDEHDDSVGDKEEKEEEAQEAEEPDGLAELQTEEYMHIEEFQGAKIIVHKGSEVDLQGEGNWVITVPRGCTNTDVLKMAEHMPQGTQAKFEGDPDHGGLCVFIMRGTKAGVKEELATHTWPSPPTVESDHAWSAIPEIDEADDGDSLLETTELSENGAQPNPPSWGLDRIDGRSRSGDKTYAPRDGLNGAGVHVYILDTGIRTSHGDFEGRAVPTLESLSSTRKVCEPTDTTCAFDKQGHGTHCAATVGGKKYGVAKGSILHAVKVLTDKGGGSFSWFVQALDWIMAYGEEPAVASASLGARGTFSSVAVAVEEAVGSGITVVVAAGNYGRTKYPLACQYTPANIPDAITVGATSSKDKRASYSNYGACLDIFAPGSAIRSASKKSDNAQTKMSGTSMACPHVAGAAALILQEDPDLEPSDVLDALLEHATTGKVRNKKQGSPDKLLYVGS